METSPRLDGTVADNSPVPWWLSPRSRAVLSVLILLHILAVAGEPLRMFTQGRQPTAPDAGIVRSSLGPYIDFMYLHHGYFFFAPNPGPSHLIDIQLVDSDGSRRHLRLPNHRAQWPRLLYHRHFMLSEFLFQLYTPAPSSAGNDGELPPPQQWQRERAMFERVRNSMEEHLATRYNAARAEIQLMEHRLPSAIEVFDERLKLDDEKLYILIPDQPLPAETDPATLPTSQPVPPSTTQGSATQGSASTQGSAAPVTPGPLTPVAPAPVPAAPSGAIPGSNPLRQEANQRGSGRGS